MALSIDVRLPRDLVPAWPDRCVRCDAASPQARARFVDRSTTWLTTVMMRFAPKVAVQVPACPSCARALTWQQRIQQATMLVSVVAGVWAGRWVVPLLPGLPPGLVLGGTALVACVPAVIWRTVKAPRFAIQAWDQHIDYEFTDPRYAAEFAAMNGVEPR